MSHKCWCKLDLTPKFSKPFSRRIKNFPSTYILENFAPSLTWLTYYPALVGFNFSTEFSQSFFLSVLCMGFVSKPKTTNTLWGCLHGLEGQLTLSYGMCFHVPSIRGFGKVVKKFGSLLLKTRNPGFYLSHSLLPSSSAEMFDNFWMSSQAVLTFHSETFGNLLIDRQPLAKKKKKKKPPFFANVL